jgi:hypothetical protein
LTERLNIKFIEEWRKVEYKPTMVGRPWMGTGAYNSRYQQHKYGLLKNDPDSVALGSAGPNEYVTKRWKIRLSKKEIELLEMLFNDEITDGNYEKIFYKKLKHPRLSAIWSSIFPFRGELPNLSWVRNGTHISKKETFQRLFYCISFLPFYIISRIYLNYLIASNYFNSNIYPEISKNKLNNDK